jgi:hypothetical protein
MTKCIGDSYILKCHEMSWCSWVASVMHNGTIVVKLNRKPWHLISSGVEEKSTWSGQIELNRQVYPCPVSTLHYSFSSLKYQVPMTVSNMCLCFSSQ